jgi:hypothetical protein
VQHVVKEIPQLGDMDVDGTGIQFPDILKVADIGPDLFPGDGRKCASGELVFDPLDISFQIGNVRGNCPGSKVAERKDIPVFFNKSDVGFKHSEGPPVKRSVSSYRKLYGRGPTALEK